MQTFIRILFISALLMALALTVCVIGFFYDLSRFPEDDLAGGEWFYMGAYALVGTVLLGGVACLFWIIERVARP